MNWRLLYATCCSTSELLVPLLYIAFLEVNSEKLLKDGNTAVNQVSRTWVVYTYQTCQNTQHLLLEFGGNRTEIKLSEQQDKLNHLCNRKSLDDNTRILIANILLHYAFMQKYCIDILLSVLIIYRNSQIVPKISDL